MLSARSKLGLTPHQIEQCEIIWEVLGGNDYCALETSEASRSGSRTRFSQTRKIVFLGADVVPGSGIDARSTMSEMACLAHELAHALRFEMEINRPMVPPDSYLDEAEASLYASFMLSISVTDRRNLIEDARVQIAAWQADDAKQQSEQEQNNEN